MSGTYIGLRLNLKTATLLHNWLKDLGIPGTIPKTEFHTTLYYAEEKPIKGFNPDPSRVHKMTVKGYEVLGAGKWGAIVLKCECPSLVRRHEAIKKVFGVPHSYPSLNIHVSLKYKPTPEDFEKLKAAPLPEFKLEATNEYTERLRD